MQMPQLCITVSSKMAVAVCDACCMPKTNIATSKGEAHKKCGVRLNLRHWLYHAVPFCLSVCAV